MKTAQFTDDVGNSWSLRADVAAAKRIRDLANIDLTQILNDKDVVSEITNSNEKFVEVLYAWCHPTCIERNISPEQFGSNVYESLESAWEAALGLIPFFSPLHRRETAAQIIAKFLEAEKRANDRVKQTINSGKFDQTVDKCLDIAEARAFESVTRSIGGDESTTSPECSESTPSENRFEP